MSNPISKNTNSFPQDTTVVKNLTVKNNVTTLTSTTNYNLETSEIVNNASQINSISSGNHKIIVENGLFEVESRLGKIKLTSNNPDNDAILIKNINEDAGIKLESGTQGIGFVSEGDVNILANDKDIGIGDSLTNNVLITSNENVLINSDTFNTVTSDDIFLKSTLGEIILDTNISNPNYSTLRCDTDGNIIMNGNESESNFQTELHVVDENESNSGRNGLLVLSKNANVTPEIRISYANEDNSNKIINTMGVYSETSSVAEFRKYYGFQYDNKLVALEGIIFQESDIGRKVVFKQDGRVTTINNLSTLILNPDITHSNVDITITGTYLGDTNKNYKIEIDSLTDTNIGRTSDTFRWSNDSGNNYKDTYIPITYAETPNVYLLEDGINISFSSNSSIGNQIGEFISFNTKIIALVDDNYNVDGDNEEEKITNALLKSQTFITTSPFNAFFGTATNHDMILKTADQERFRITADGSIGASKDKIDARLHLTSEINKVTQVNENLVSLGVNVKGEQLNSVSTELNTGGYIVVYETIEANNTTYDIYGDYFTANGEKVSNMTSFKVNDELLYNQSHPHIAHSGDIQSDNYIVVWVTQDPEDVNKYQIKGSIFKNGNEPVRNNSTLISSSTSNITLTPRVAGLSNGNYVVVYTSLQDETNDSIDNELYNIKYAILDNNGNIIRSERAVSNVSNGLNHVYPYVIGLNANDSNNKYAGGFVISYMKEVFTQDNRYQIVYKVFTSDGLSNTPEHEITTTGERGETGFLNTDFNLSDSRASLLSIPRNLAVTDGGFIVSYKSNFSASVAFTTSPTRTVTGVSSGASGALSTSVVDETTGVHTVVINRTNGTFLDGELIYLLSDIQGEADFFLEKIQTVTTEMEGGFKKSNMILSKDPKSVIIARYSTSDIDNAEPDNLIYRKKINTTNLINDRLLTSINDNTPLNFIRANTIYYGYRGLPVIKHNNDTKGICVWQTGFEPNIHYQQFNLLDGSLVDREELVSEEYLGYRQTDPYVCLLKTTQGNLLGYSICFTASGLDESGNGIFQQLIGPFSYLFHMNNDNAEFVLDNKSRLGIGTRNPEGDIHIKTTPTLIKNNIDQVIFIMQNSTDHINNQDDLHRLTFKDGSGDELGRIKVKYSNNYQDMNPDADNLVAFFKLDEKVGSLIAVDNGLYNLQVETDIDLISSSRGASALLKGFDVNNCWKPGIINNGLEFNGLTSYLLIPKNGENNTYINTIDELHNSSFTISLWCKIDRNIFNGTSMDLLSFGDAELSEGYGGGSGFFQISLKDNLNDGNLRPCFNGLFTVNNNSDVLMEESIQVLNIDGLNDGNWHNLIVIHDRTLVDDEPNESRIVMYLDGEEVGNSDVTFGSNVYLLGSLEEITRDREVYIGSGVAGSKNYYRGMLDELRFYRSSLSSSDISRIYKYGSQLRSQIQIQTLGDNNNYSDLEPGLTIDDTGSIIGCRFKNNISRQLTGIVKIALLTPTIVEGVDSTTKFISELKVGDNLFLDLTPDGQDIGMAIAGNFFQIKNIISNTKLTLNRKVNIISDTFFSHVTIRPSVFSAYDDNELMRMNMDFSGDLSIGDGKSAVDLTKLEIRGDGSSRVNKNSLTLSNTSVNVDNFYTNNARSNKIQFKANSNSNSINEIIMGTLEIAHSNSSVTDDKACLNIKLNDGSQTNNNSLNNIISLYGSGKFNFGNNILEKDMLNDIQFNGKLSNGGENIKLGFLSNEPATGVYTESTHLCFYGANSLDRNQNTNPPDNSALIKILVSNDKLVYSNVDDTSLANGRLDFQVNKQLGSSISGLKSRFCLTSGGYAGVHITRPNVVFDVSPEFNEDNIKDNPITSIDTNNNIITFSDNDPETAPLFSSLDSDYLRCGRMVVNDGSNLTSYIIKSNVLGDVIDTFSNLSIDDNEVLTSNLILNKSYTLHYPGLKVNKYGLVGIGDSRFNDSNKDYHLSVSGDCCVKGEFNLASNIDVLDTSNISKVGFKTNSSGDLLFKDNNTVDYVKVFGGPSSSTINKYSVDTVLTYNNSTVLVNNTVDEQIDITIPDTSSDYMGRIFNIKKISNVGNVRVMCNDSAKIDNYVEQFLENQYSGFTIQTDGENWFIISSHIVPEDISSL